MTPFCAAIDWGTSSFRLWLLSNDGAVLAERRSDEGMIRAANTGFDAVLERHLAELGAPAKLPVIICGMAGARQGWREAGYLDTPADVADIIRNALIVDGYPRDVRILPGIAQREAGAPDVMRGEETQLLGLVADGVRSGLVCMPGTHSKWVTLGGGKVEGFSTYMTGELFRRSLAPFDPECGDGGAVRSRAGRCGVSRSGEFGIRQTFVPVEPAVSRSLGAIARL